MLFEQIRARARSNRRRLAKLTASRVDDSDEADLNRFCRVVVAIQDTPGFTEEASEVVLRWLVEQRHWQTPNPDRDGPDSDRGKRIEERNRLCVAAMVFFNQLPVDLRAIVARTAFPDENFEGERWAADWCQSAASLDSRIPEELKPEVMESLVAIYQDQADKIDGCEVCCSCGLRRPRHRMPPLTEWRAVPDINRGVLPKYILPRFFESCPACGSTEKVWEGHSHEQPYPWRAQAAYELDLRRLVPTP